MIPEDFSWEGSLEPEMITILEGPTPDFRPVEAYWPISVSEGPKPLGIAFCELRTFNGPQMLQRCRTAWEEGRPVLLDFPDRMGMRHQVTVIAARYEIVPEGHKLLLWVQA